MRGRSGRWPLLAATVVIASADFGWLHAQSPQTPQTTAAGPAASAAQAPLPVRRVILYKSGVGYFEHVGRVRGNQSVTIDFTSGQLDDVLSSLTTVDLGGGRVLGVSYNSEDALDRRLSSLRLPVGAATSRAQLLESLRGARVEVGPPGGRVTGRLLSVEHTTRQIAGGTTVTDSVSVVSDAGEIHTISLDAPATVRLVDADLRQDVAQYLALVASAREQDQRRMTIATSGTGDRDLFVSYVSEVPVWKATYRLVLPAVGAARKPFLQGWAIVDNTAGQDWDNVALSLVAGAPQSFIQQISRPYYLQRAVVPLPSAVSLAPQTHDSALGTAGVSAISGTVTDAAGRPLSGVTIQLSGALGNVAQSVTDQAGRYRLPSVAPGRYAITVTHAGFRTEERTNVNVSGGTDYVLNVAMTVGSPAQRSSTILGLPQATIAVTIDGVNVQEQGLHSTDGFFAVQRPQTDMVEEATVGESSATFRAGVGGGRGAGAGVGSGRGFGTAPSPAPPAMYSSLVAEARLAQQADANGQALGDLFQYQLKDPVTIRRNQSALVPILAGDVEAERVSLWNPASGGSRPLRAVWLTNSTGNTLDGGSFSVIDGEAFAGEGLVQPMKPAERRLMSYAADLGVQVVPSTDSQPTSVTRVAITRGLLIQYTEQRQQTTYVVRNEDTDSRVVVIEHPVRAGWTLAATSKADETTAQWERFRVPVAPKTTVNFVVEESRAGQTQYAVSSVTDDQLAVLVRGQFITPAVEAQLREVMRQKAEVARLTGEMQKRQTAVETIGKDQQRVRENMQALKGSSEEKQLLQRYVKQLDDQETQLGTLRKELESLTATRSQAQATLNTFIGGLTVGAGGA